MNTVNTETKIQAGVTFPTNVEGNGLENVLPGNVTNVADVKDGIAAVHCFNGWNLQAKLHLEGSSHTEIVSLRTQTPKGVVSDWRKITGAELRNTSSRALDYLLNTGCGLCADDIITVRTAFCQVLPMLAKQEAFLTYKTSLNAIPFELADYIVNLRKDYTNKFATDEDSVIFENGKPWAKVKDGTIYIRTNLFQGVLDEIESGWNANKLLEQFEMEGLLKKSETNQRSNGRAVEMRMEERYPNKRFYAIRIPKGGA